MIKILYIDTHNTFGGGQTMLLRLIEGLDKSKFLPIVVCSKDNQKFIQEFKKISIKFIPIKTKILILENKFLKAILQFPNFIKANFKIAQIIKKTKPDIIHVNLFYSALFSIIPVKLCRKPFIWVALTPSDLLRYKIFTKFLIQFSDRTILICKDFIRIAKKNNLNTSKLQTIYAGLKIEDYYQKGSSGNEIEINGQKIKKPIVVMIARFDRYQKGHQYFIEAAKIIKEKISNANFLIIGGAANPEEENYKRELENKVKKLGLSNKILFTGFYPDLVYLLSNIEVVVIPSLCEGAPAVALEAMAMKRSVVASNVGGIPEVVVDGETGFLVPLKNPEAIAEKVIFLLKNPKKAKEMGEKGYQRVKTCFTLEKMVREHEKVYYELLI